jgi:hypothetical protein
LDLLSFQEPDNTRHLTLFEKTKNAIELLRTKHITRLNVKLPCTLQNTHAHRTPFFPNVEHLKFLARNWHMTVAERHKQTRYFTGSKAIMLYSYVEDATRQKHDAYDHVRDLLPDSFVPFVVRKNVALEKDDILQKLRDEKPVFIRKCAMLRKLVESRQAAWYHHGHLTASRAIVEAIRSNNTFWL